MRYLLGVMCCLLLSGLVPAQESSTFNMVHQNLVEGPAVGFSVREVPNGYLVFSNQRGWYGTPQDPFTTLLSESGIVAQERDYTTSEPTNIGLPDPIAASANGLYYCGVTNRSDSLHDRIFLYCFDAIGDTTYTRFVIGDTIMIVRKCLQTLNNDLLFTGLHESPKEQFCLRTDTMGNILGWFAYPGFDGSGIAEDTSGNIYLSGQWIYPNQRGSLIKCNAVGAVEWFQLQPLGPATTGIYRTVIALADGNALALGTCTQYLNPFPDQNYAHAACYSGAGDLLWQDTARATSGSALVAELNDGYQKSDGNIVTAGSFTSTETGGHGFVRVYSPNGSVVWDREFTYYDTIASTGTHRIWDVESTNDGGMVLTGEAWHFGQQSPQNLWVVKLDSLGCLVPGCQGVGITEQATNWKGALRLWPNPVHVGDVLQVELPEGLRGAKDARIVLVDQAGKRLLQEPWRQGQVLQEVIIPDIPAGMYYLHLITGGTWLSGGKVVVE